MRVVAVLMSHLLGAGASNADINPIYFLEANGADGCRQGTLCGGVEKLTNGC